MLAIIAAVVTIALFSGKNVTIGTLDWALLSIAAFEIASVCFGKFQPNGIRSAWFTVLAILMFYAVRLTVRAPVHIALFCAPLTIGGALLGVQSLYQFVTNSRLLHEVGLSQLIAFRSRLIIPPAPWLPGEWFTILLLSLPFACSLVAYLLQLSRYTGAILVVILLVLINVSLFLSLSRAVFWSTIAFYVALGVLLTAYKILGFKRGALLLFFFIIGSGLLLGGESLIYPGIFTAYTGQHVSQTRSTQGRLTIWKRSVSLARTHPISGVGSGNAALFLLSTADADETTGFASRTFSLPVQILLEKGILGFLLYGGTVLVLLIEFLRAMRTFEQSHTSAKLSRATAKSTGADLAFASRTGRIMRCCFLAGFFAVLLRECAYSSILEHGLTLVLAMSLAALFCFSESRLAE